jgi:coenzyme Q-binding protein COQ10
MPTFRTSRRVQHAAVEMFDLVADVEGYPDFLPLCQGLKVRKRTDLGDGREQLVADMSIGYKAIRETFVSRVTLDRPKLEIAVEYVDGPFRRMENRWTFRDSEPVTVPASSAVEFFIDYEFKSRMFGLLMGSVFDAAFRRFAEAFEQRADRKYPPGSALSAV